MHDLLITSGVYALTGREVTAATVAALLTILGYSLYDTIIVFDRVRENIPRMPRAAFSQIVNRSMSEVLTRSLATTFCTLLPILALLLFGGATLQDFAFALLIGVASGAYSSIFIASPVLTHWKEREAGYRARRQRIEEELGDVSRPTPPAGADVEPVRKRSRRPGRLTEPEPETVSAAEFEQMKRDLESRAGAPGPPHLDADQAPAAHARSRRPRRAHSPSRAERQPEPAEAPKPAGGASTPRRRRRPPPRSRCPRTAAATGADPARDAGRQPDALERAPDIAENEGVAPVPATQAARASRARATAVTGDAEVSR